MIRIAKPSEPYQPDDERRPIQIGPRNVHDFRNYVALIGRIHSMESKLSKLQERAAELRVKIAANEEREAVA